MSKLKILDKKSFQVGRRKVTVRRQDNAGSDKPHQVLIWAQAQGVAIKETWSYPSPGNPDYEYACFDQVKAEQFVGKLLKWLATPKGAAHAAG